MNQIRRQNNNRIYRELFTTFLKIGSVTFGGGYAMLPLLQKELVEKKSWLTEEEILDYFAIGQSTPGIIAINTATFAGYKVGGIPGALAATLGMITPSLIIITVIASVLGNFNENLIVQKALKGVNIAVTILLISSVWKFYKKAVKDFPGILIFLSAFVLAAFTGVSPVPIVSGSAVLGIIIQTLRRRRTL